MTVAMLGGAFTNLPSSNVAGAQSYAQAFPGATVFRWFHSGMPSDIAQTSAAGCYDVGLIPFLSVKPSYTNVGSDNAKITSLAKSMKSGYLVAWHEPENDMTPAQFVAMQVNFYKTVKAANPKLLVGYVAMAYQWGVGKSVPTPDAWYPGDSYCDFLACDTYSDSWRSTLAAGPIPVDNLADYQRWYGWAKGKGKPLVQAELGCDVAFSDVQRAAWYDHAIKWLSAKGFVLLLPWNGNSTPGNSQFYYWGGPVAFPLAAQVIRDATVPPPDVAALQAQVTDLRAQVVSLQQQRDDLHAAYSGALDTVQAALDAGRSGLSA